MIHALRGGLSAVAGLLLIPLLAAAQPEQLAPKPPQRPIRTRPAAATPTGVQPAVAPQTPGGPVDRSAGADKATVTANGLVNLDFEDVELAVVIDTIAKLTGKNFVYDDRVRGRVTIISPSPIPVAQAFTVFESVLQVKGFTTVEAPGGVLKVIPIRDAKETSIDTQSSARATPDTDRFVTRLIPLSYIDAEQIANTLKPLVSKEAALVAYAGTNTIILTDSASNITRILSILEAVDVETFKEELALLRLQYADATVVADQLSQLFGAEVMGGARQSTAAARVRARPQPVVPGQPQPGQSPAASRRGQVRIITDERTNSLVALASRATLEEVRDFIRKIDLPVEGGGRIQVYYLKHADAEELADTLNSLLGGGGGGGGGGAQGMQGAPQIAGQVTEIVSGVDLVTSDVATNSLVIQASPEGYQALLSVIDKLDIARPQVLVEALIMEVGLTDNESLGFNGLVRLVNGATDIAIRSATDDSTLGALRSGRTCRRGRPVPHQLPAAHLLRHGCVPDEQRLADPGSDPSVGHRQQHQHHLGAPHPHVGQRGSRDPRRQQHPDHHEPRAAGRHDRHHHRRQLARDVGERRASGHRRDAARDSADHRGRHPSNGDLPGDHRHQQPDPG